MSASRGIGRAHLLSDRGNWGTVNRRSLAIVFHVAPKEMCFHRRAHDLELATTLMKRLGQEVLEVAVLKKDRASAFEQDQGFRRA